MNQFKRQIADIRKIYSDCLKKENYPNSDKLAFLFEYWLHIFFLGLQNKQEMPSNCLGLFAVLSKKDNIQYTKKPELKKNAAYLWGKNLFWRIASRIPIREGVLPGGSIRKMDEFTAKMTYYKLIYCKIERNQELKSDFLNQAAMVFDRKLYGVFAKTVSNWFFLKRIEGNSLPGRYIGSPICLFGDNYIKLLFSNRKVHFTGVQHGGNYGEFKDNFAESMERQISDLFYYWGFGENNIRPNRFSIVPPEERRVKRLVLVGSIKPNYLINYYFKGWCTIYEDCESYQKEWVPKLSKSKPIHYMVHPKYPMTQNIFHSTIYLKRLSQEYINSSLFIIDRPGQTFLYQAICESIPFLLYYKSDWKRFLTSNFIGFLDFLESCNLLFDWNKESAFFNTVEKFFNNQTYNASFFASARKYLEKGVS